MKLEGDSERNEVKRRISFFYSFSNNKENIILLQVQFVIIEN